MNTLSAQSNTPEIIWRKFSIDEVFLISSLVIFHFDVIGYRAAWTPGYFGLFLLASYFAKSWAIFQISLMAFLWGMLSYFLPSFIVGTSAIYLLIIFLATVGIGRFIARNNSKLDWFTRGKIDKLSVALMALTAVISGAALIVWASWTDNLGLGKQMVLSVASMPKPVVLVFGVPLFAMLNAFSEEVIYRGFFQECFQKVLQNPALAIAAQASVFASLHYATGFPNGPVGYAMTFVYGATLGFIRYRTKGILAPYLTHITADLVIIYYLCYQFL